MDIPYFEWVNGTGFILSRFDNLAVFIAINLRSYASTNCGLVFRVIAYRDITPRVWEGGGGLDLWLTVKSPQRRPYIGVKQVSVSLFLVECAILDVLYTNSLLIWHINLKKKPMLLLLLLLLPLMFCCSYYWHWCYCCSLSCKAGL